MNCKLIIFCAFLGMALAGIVKRSSQPINTDDRVLGTLDAITATTTPDEGTVNGVTTTTALILEEVPSRSVPDFNIDIELNTVNCGQVDTVVTTPADQLQSDQAQADQASQSNQTEVSHSENEINSTDTISKTSENETLTTTQSEVTSTSANLTEVPVIATTAAASPTTMSAEVTTTVAQQSTGAQTTTNSPTK